MKFRGERRVYESFRQEEISREPIGYKDRWLRNTGRVLYGKKYNIPNIEPRFFDSPFHGLAIY
jgi:hypothetical protein